MAETRGRDRVTRVAADLFDSAAAEGVREHRSAKQQLEYWALIGRSVSTQQSAARRRVEAALSGELPLRELTGVESIVGNAEIDARIEERLAATNFGQRLAAEGVATVALNDAGELVRYLPDGSTELLAVR